MLAMFSVGVGEILFSAVVCVGLAAFTWFYREAWRLSVVAAVILLLAMVSTPADPLSTMLAAVIGIGSLAAGVHLAPTLRHDRTPV